MNIVLVQELIRFNELLFIIKDSIFDIKKAVNGQIVMSNTLEEVYNSMIAGNLPELWASKSYPSLKSLGSYIADLCERIKFFNVRTSIFQVYKTKLKFKIFHFYLYIKGMDKNRRSKGLLVAGIFFRTIIFNRNYAKLC